MNIGKKLRDTIILHHIRFSHQLTIKNLNLKVDYHKGASGSCTAQKHHKENQLLSLEHPCWLYSVNNVNLIWSRSEVTFQSDFSQRKSMDRNILGSCLLCRNRVSRIHQFILRKYSQHPVQDNQWPDRAGHLRPPLSPSVRHLYTNHTPLHLDI